MSTEGNRGVRALMRLAFFIGLSQASAESRARVDGDRMLATRFVGRHWVALVLVLGVMLLVIGGRVGRDFGLYFLFRSDLSADGAPDAGLSVLASRPFLTGFYLSYLVSFLYCYALAQDALERGRAKGVTGWLDADPAPPSLLSIVLNLLPFLILPVTVFNIPLSEAIEPPGSDDRWHNLLGAVAGMLPVSIIALISSSACANRLLPQTRLGKILFSPRCRLVGILLMMLVINIFFDAGYSFASLINLAGWILLAYLLWDVLPLVSKTAVLAAVVVVVIGAHVLNLTFGTPNDVDWRSVYARPVEVPSRPGSVSSQGPTSLLVDPVTALKAWRKAASAGSTKGKLVILAASGGGYRATFWTANVIDRLREESRPGRRLADFIQSVRLVTGASGGMVANAYFVAQEQGVCGASKDRFLLDQIRADVSRYYASHGFDAERGNDSLSAVARQWVKADLFGLGPGRAHTLEEQWLSLCSPLEALSAAERDGKAPSFIIAPTVVEDGRPILISNLDLTRMWPRAAGLAWDFSQLFTAGHQKLKLRTAARMSASFPYVTPAETLPTHPRMRAVDAGYSDNYGVTAAVAYLSDPEVKRWIEDNLSGVVLVEIWSHSEDGAEAACGSHATAPPTPATTFGYLRQGFTLLDRMTEPFSAGFAAREVAMVAHNRLQLANLASQYPIGMLRHVVIGNRVKGSLSWYLPESEINCLLAQWRADRDHPSFAALAEAWSN